VGQIAVVEMVNAQLPAEASSRLEEIAREIDDIREQGVFLIGERLVEALKIYRYNRAEGGFRGWVEARLRMSLRVAYRRISACEAFAKESVPLVAHFPAQLLCDLATDVATPVREEVVARLSAGDEMAPSEIKRRLREVREAAMRERMSDKKKRLERRRQRDTKRRAERAVEEQAAQDAARTKARQEAARMIAAALGDDVIRLIELLKVGGPIGYYHLEDLIFGKKEVRLPATLNS
jgi:hypothetical protein